MNSLPMFLLKRRIYEEEKKRKNDRNERMKRERKEREEGREGEKGVSFLPTPNPRDTNSVQYILRASRIYFFTSSLTYLPTYVRTYLLSIHDEPWRTRTKRLPPPARPP